MLPIVYMGSGEDSMQSLPNYFTLVIFTDKACDTLAVLDSRQKLPSSDCKDYRPNDSSLSKVPAIYMTAL